MTRRDLLNSRAYVTSGIQLKLLNLIEEYMKEKKITRTELAKELKVSKGYITQILNADYDHKISKLVDLALSVNKMPLINFVDLERFIREDANDKIYELFPMQRPKRVTYEKSSQYQLKTEIRASATTKSTDTPKYNPQFGYSTQL